MGRIIVQTVPWYNKEEFESVFNCVYSGNVFAMKWAAARIAVWSARVTTGLSIGIIATAAIANAMVQDELYESNAATSTPDDLRALYSSALIRFVNYVSDLARTGHDRNKKTPVRVAALKMGIPEWIIHLRNDATHGVMPSLDSLRSGAYVAFQWLKEKFWEQERLSFTDFIALKNSDVMTVQYLQSYIDAHYKVLSENVESRQAENEKKLEKILFTISKSLVCNLNFFDELLRPGLFFPTIATLNKILPESKKFIHEKTITLPPMLQKFWMPIVRIIIRKDRLQLFVESLFKFLNSPDQLISKVAACWIQKIILEDETDEHFLYQGFSDDDYKPCLNWFKLHGLSLHYNCEYSPGIVPIIIDRLDPPLDENKKNVLMGLLLIHNFPNNESEVPTNEERQVFTVDDIKNDVRLRQEDKGIDNIWHEVPESFNWSDIPLGFVFGDQNSFSTQKFYPNEAFTVPQESTGVGITVQDPM